jgi:hypothetical protein
VSICAPSIPCLGVIPTARVLRAPPSPRRPCCATAGESSSRRRCRVKHVRRGHVPQRLRPSARLAPLAVLRPA